MREILFRGKDVKSGRWHEGNLVALDADSGHVFIVPSLTRASTLPVCAIVDYTAVYVDTNTVGQFTGLTDKNGNKIFEGDIVKYNDTVGTVSYADGAFGVKLDERCGVFLTFAAESCEVIGNVHDNKELLEVTNV